MKSQITRNFSHRFLKKGENAICELNDNKVIIPDNFQSLLTGAIEFIGSSFSNRSEINIKVPDDFDMVISNITIEDLIYWQGYQVDGQFKIFDKVGLYDNASRLLYLPIDISNSDTVFITTAKTRDGSFNTLALVVDNFIIIILLTQYYGGMAHGKE